MKLNHPIHPTFAANIAFVSDFTFNKIITFVKATEVAKDSWLINNPDQLEPLNASYTTRAFDCTTMAITNGDGYGRVAHLDPKTNTISTIKARLKRYKNITSCVIAGGRINRPNVSKGAVEKTKALFNGLIRFFKKYQPSYFLEQQVKLNLLHIGKDVNLPAHLKDTVFINPILGPSHSSSLATISRYLNGAFGKWYVSPNDKLVWVNERLDISHPNFVEEIPRALYDTHA
jgi:hypothetical protein